MDKPNSFDFSAFYLSMQDSEEQSKETCGRTKAIADEAKKKGIDAKPRIGQAKKLIESIELIDDDARAILLDAINEAESIADYLTVTANKLVKFTEYAEYIRTSSAYKTKTVEIIKQKTARAQAGLSGARSKHSKANALKTWAEREAAGRCSLGMARELAGRAPAHLLKAIDSVDHVRLIYDHLRKVNKQRNTAS